MHKSEKTLLKFAVIGTLVAFGMALFSYLFFREPAAPSVTQPVSTLDEVDATDNGSQPMAEDDPMSTSDLSTFEIDAAQSEVRFTLNELLGGEPTTVVGTTNLVSGPISFSADAPQDAKLGEIAVNARGFATDNGFRNRAIHNAILDTGGYEYIRFVPTAITGLPDALTLGEPASLEISGTLTIKNISHEVTFSAQVTPVSQTELAGHAETMVAYADYDIFIPSAPRVADVDEEVLLEIDFVALLASE